MNRNKKENAIIILLGILAAPFMILYYILKGTK